MRQSISSTIMALASICAMRTSSLAFSSGCITPRITKVPAWGWLPCSGSFGAMAGASGPKEKSTRARRSPLLLEANRPMTEHQVEILLVEDNTSDIKLTLHAFKQYHLANQIHVARD